jgi:DNA-binding YbaB/EbfC family protein
MKLPKGFGGQGFSGAVAQAQQAMARARQLEDELAAERIPIDKGPVKAIFDGTGQLLQIKLDASVVDPDDIEALEDLIVSAVRDGFDTATAARNAKVQAIMPNIPGLG